MLAAHRMNLTDPQTNVWYTLDLFNASYFGHGSWQRGDSHDADAYESYKALQVLTLRTNIRNLKRINQKTDNKKDELAETSFANFTSSLEVEYQKMGLLSDGQPLRVNSFVEGFHDSLILYAFAIDASLNDGTDWRNGQSITEQMRMRQMNGIGSQVKIDAHGNRYGDYSLLAMVENQQQQFKFRTVYTDLRSRGITSDFKPYDSSTLMPTINVPDVPVWETQGDPTNQNQDTLQAARPEATQIPIVVESWWFYAGSIILMILGVTLTIIGSVLCCRRIRSNRKVPHLQLAYSDIPDRPLQKELSTFPSKTKIERRRSSGSRPLSADVRGHCAVQRTVTQVTYCSDNDYPNNRDSGLVESA